MENNILRLSLLNEELNSVKGLSSQEITQLLMFSTTPKTEQEIAELYFKTKGTIKIRIAIAGLLHEYQTNLTRPQSEKIEEQKQALNSIINFVVSNCKVYNPDDIVTTMAFSQPKYRRVYNGTHCVGTIKNKNVSKLKPKTTKIKDCPNNENKKGIIFKEDFLKQKDVKTYCKIYENLYKEIANKNIKENSMTK